MLKFTLNTRPILENSLKYIRSDVPTTVTEQERELLLFNGVTSILDLRTDKERAQKHCPLMEDRRFTYECFPLKGGDRVPDCVDAVSSSYIAMVDERFEEKIEALLRTDVGVLYFCNAGKDRTGVMSAALLYRLGTPIPYIVEDYMKSKENLAATLTAYARQNPMVDIRVITPQRRYIEEFLAWYTDPNNALRR